MGSGLIGNAYDGLKQAANSNLYVLERLTNYKDPQRFNHRDYMMDLFREIHAHKVSDIFIQEARPICVLKRGVLFAITEKCIDRGEAQWFLSAVGTPTSLTQINAKNSINTSYGLYSFDNKRTINGAMARDNFRVNVVGTTLGGEGCFQIVMRTIPSEPYRFDKIGLTEDFVIRCCPPKGIVLIAGVTGSGKSTTIASVLRYVLENDTPIKGNIITHEEPIEYTYDNIQTSHSIIQQSQIPENFKNFVDANREAMRRKPAAILVGELRDSETISCAVEASLTGHPVFATVHSSSVVTIISRLLSRYPTNEKSAALYDILQCSKMLIAQRLIAKVNGDLMGVQEWLELNTDIRNELLSLDTVQEVNQRIRQLMSTGNGFNHASLTFKKQGDQLVADGVISPSTLIYLNEE